MSSDPLLGSQDVAGKWGVRGWSGPRSQVSLWNGPPSEGPGFAEEKFKSEPQ